MTITKKGNKYQVLSTSGKTYTVANGHCTCPHHYYRKAYCKHMKAVENFKPKTTQTPLKDMSLEEFNELFFDFG